MPVEDPVAAHTRRTRDAYNRLAPIWSATTDDGPFNAHLDRPARRSLIPRPLAGTTIFDAGCGSGPQCEWLLDAARHRRVCRHRLRHRPDRRGPPVRRSSATVPRRSRAGAGRPTFYRLPTGCSRRSATQALCRLGRGRRLRARYTIARPSKRRRGAAADQLTVVGTTGAGQHRRRRVDGSGCHDRRALPRPVVAPRPRHLPMRRSSRAESGCR